MIIGKPAYFEKFCCLAGDCPDSCCKDWDVLVDDRAATRYSTLTGELGDRLRQVMYRQEESTWFAVQPDGRCPMWRHDGLCRIQAELGHEALCHVCRTFPRLRHDYGDFVEEMLELSCPEAARLIISSPDTPWTEETLPGGEAEYDTEAMEILLQVRREALEILRDVRYSPNEALALLLLHGHQSQAWLDGGEKNNFDPDAALELGKRLAKVEKPQVLREFYLGLEILTPEWKSWLEAPAVSTAWPEETRALARYFVQRYYLQAVSDYDLVGRVKLAVVSAILIRQLGGDFITTAQRYSKEIENDASNVDAILDGAYAAPALTDDRLLGWLLNAAER